MSATGLVVEHVAGGRTCGGSTGGALTANYDYGSGCPAMEAVIEGPTSLAIAPDSSIVFSSYSPAMVGRLGTDGVVRMVAGQGSSPFSEGAVATEVQLSEPFGVAVEPDGTVFLADRGLFRVLRISPQGIITTVAGRGVYYSTESSQAGKLATEADIRPDHVRRGPDGLLYFGDSFGIYRIQPSGTLDLVVPHGGATRGAFDFGAMATTTTRCLMGRWPPAVGCPTRGRSP